MNGLVYTFIEILKEHFVIILLFAIGIFFAVGMYASWKHRIECQTILAEKKVAVQDIKKLCN